MISHKNYMERIVDYYDKKLSQSESDALVAFLKMNSELYEEFLMFGESLPETANEADLKAPASLLKQLKNIPEEIFVLTNELLVAYAEKDLDAYTIRKVEETIAQNPQQKRDLEIISAVHYEADETIAFPHKNKLLRREPIIISFRRILYYTSATAAIFILAFFLWPNSDKHSGLQSSENTFANLILKKKSDVNTAAEKIANYSVAVNTYSRTPQLADNNVTQARSYENILPLAPCVASQLQEVQRVNAETITNLDNKYLAIYEMIEFKNSITEPNKNKTGTLTEWKDWGKGIFTGKSSVKNTPIIMTLHDVAEFSKTNLTRIAIENLSFSQ